jgi:chemosensory pili system protein ChpA (sensor histidine kinase/response regulator)
VTLAGTGEIVLLLDDQQLCELATSHRSSRLDEQQPTSASGEHPGKPRTVLVVDDSLSARRTLVRALRARGFEVVEAGDGLDAQSRLRDQEFEAIFSDLEMPRQGGFELLQEVKTNVDTASIPVVIVSSRTEEEIQTRALELGAVAYHTKPLREQDLDKTLAQLKSADSVEA